jgi:hypothetical protein
MVSVAIALPSSVVAVTPLASGVVMQ